MVKRVLAGMAAAVAACGLLAGCGAQEPAPVPAPPEPLEWVIVDESSRRLGWNSGVMEAVFSALPETPRVTRYTGDQNSRVSRMLDRSALPDIITVPADSALRDKIVGSGNLYGMRELSPALYDSVPRPVRDYYQRQEDDLYCLPGGYYETGYRPIAAEGVYVREEYYSLLGEPAMDTPRRFAGALESFVRLMTENGLTGSGEPVPLVFGVQNAGVATAEHIGGLLPLHWQGSTGYHRLFSPQVKQVLSFFDSLDALSAYPIFDAYSEERLTELLKSNVFVYMGPSAFIESYNLENPRSAYRAVTPPFAPGGYLEAQSRYGGYLTFVSRSCDPARAAALLTAASSPAVSHTLMYGAEDREWVMVNGAVTPLKATLTQAREDPAGFLRRTGIGAFPFLSRDGLTNPYLEGITQHTRDLTEERATFLPNDYHSYDVMQLDGRLAAYYREVAGASVSAADIIDRIRVLESGKKPLTVFR